jgi:hypothetical protein
MTTTKNTIDWNAINAEADANGELVLAIKDQSGTVIDNPRWVQFKCDPETGVRLYDIINAAKAAHPETKELFEGLTADTGAVPVKLYELADGRDGVLMQTMDGAAQWALPLAPNAENSDAALEAGIAAIHTAAFGA